MTPIATRMRRRSRIDAGSVLKAVKGTTYSEPKFFSSHERRFPIPPEPEAWGSNDTLPGVEALRAISTRIQQESHPQIETGRAPPPPKGGEVP